MNATTLPMIDHVRLVATVEDTVANNPDWARIVALSALMQMYSADENPEATIMLPVSLVLKYAGIALAYLASKGVDLEAMHAEMVNMMEAYTDGHADN